MREGRAGFPAAGTEPCGMKLTVTFAPSVQTGPFTGRLLVFFGNPGGPEPRLGPHWFRPQPFVAREVRGLRPGQPAEIGGMGTLFFPRDRTELPAGEWVAQAALDKNQGERGVGDGAGNGFSATVPVKEGAAALTIDRVVPPAEFPAAPGVEEVAIESGLLSRFLRRRTFLRAAVVLPESYGGDPGRRFPVLYIVPGFGGTHRGHRMAGLYRGPGAPEMVRVVLDPSCATGHHVFADSANNGPCGRALIEELIPAIERRYRVRGTAAARFVTGHSSGGWSALWLQITYPDTFGGCWSTSPDPVDFTDFQRIDLYRDANLFRDISGRPRPIARQGETPALFFPGFSDMERVLGHGGQLASFEAVFSPRLPDGRPRPLWDRDTGAIDHATARAWERYDIRRLLERRWPVLGPKLAGKLRLYTGGLDTFYLEGAVEKLRAALARLGSDAKVEIFPGEDHGSVMRVLHPRLGKEMADALPQEG